jgi:endoglycosylceramidase
MRAMMSSRLRQRRFLTCVVAATAMSVVACSSDEAWMPGASSPEPLRLPHLHAEPDPVSGGRIVDAEGREVLLRGVNVIAFVEYWQGTEFPTTFPLTADDADRMQEIGWSTVRLLLSWSLVEPQPGEYDEAYLAEIDAAVRLLASRGVYTIIDLHQDAWSATLAARPNEECGPGREPAFGWDGAPGWATLDGGGPRCVQDGRRELSPAVGAAFREFWNDTPGPGGVGIRTRYVRMLGHLADHFGGDTAVAGFDLMNEPNAYQSSQQAAMARLYEEALREIRAREQEKGVQPHLVFFEPSIIWSDFGIGTPPDFERDDDIVFAPHIYTGGFDGGPITEEAFQRAQDDARLFDGAPVLSGEWGADPRRAQDESDGYFLAHQELQDRFHFGATLWTWRESCGDPHKAGEFRAGVVPFVWGEFDVDCATNTLLGERSALLRQLTRAYVRAAPGRLDETRYDPASGELTTSGSSAPAQAELLAFYPASLHGEGSVSTTGLEAVKRSRAPGGNVYITARARGGPWSLRVAAGPGF